MSADTSLAVPYDSLPTPSSTNGSTYSNLRPAPLNFSRPRPVQRPSQASRAFSHDSQFSDKSKQLEQDARRPGLASKGSFQIHRPYLNRATTDTSRIVEEEESEDDSATISSIDPSISELYKGNDAGADADDDEDDYDEAAPPPVIRTRRDEDFETNGYRGNGSSTLIFKPYASSVVSLATTSDAASVLSEATEATDATDDTRSVADSIDTGHISVSDFAYDGRMGWSPRNQSQAERERQRWTGPAPRQRPLSSVFRGLSSHKTNTTASTGTGTGSNTNNKALKLQDGSSKRDSANLEGFKARLAPPALRTKTSISIQTGSSTQSDKSPSVKGASNRLAPKDTNSTAPTIPERHPRIVKRVSMDQMSEHMGVCSSESISDNASISSSEWKSSEYDTSKLSVEQIHKLKKKGINPALYLEMKQAKKGKGKIGALTGNTFLG